MRKKRKLIMAFGLCALVAFVGSQLTISEIGGWYATLNKPFFNPPNEIFGPVWTLLYFLMAVSFYLVLKKEGDKRTAVGLFLLQLGLNLGWSFLFFYLHSPLLALGDILLLVLVIWKMIKAFRRISPLAGKLQYPYLGWTTFATLLNAAIVILN